MLSSETLAKTSTFFAGALTPWTMALCPLYFLKSLYVSTSHADTVLSALAANNTSCDENAKEMTAEVCDFKVAVF